MCFKYTRSFDRKYSETYIIQCCIVDEKPYMTHFCICITYKFRNSNYLTTAFA